MTSNKVEYNVRIETSDVKKSTGDFEIKLSLHGTKGHCTDHMKLILNKDKKLHESRLNGESVGDVSKVNISHAISEGGIHVKKLSIRSNAKEFSFEVNKWLEAGGEKSFSFKKGTNKKAKSKTKTSDTMKQESSPSEFEEGQGRLKPENKPIKNGEFELATHVELKRVKTKLYKEVAKIRYPRRKEHQPFVFNDLTPYTETRTAQNLICSSEYNAPIGYCNRFTAMGVVEPWVAHRMEHTIGPFMSRNLQHNARNKVSRNKLNRQEQFEGSTLAPNFPKVIVKKPKGMNGPFYYDDVEIIRNELQKNFKSRARFEEDRNRTINDYYRMSLDQTSESLSMSGAYHAYLENTPGSKKALEELLTKK